MKPSKAVPLAMLAAACAHYGPELVPTAAPGVAPVPGEKLEAQAASGAVQVTVSGERWHGNPSDLGALVTPMRVTIVNRGAEPVRVAYRDFALVSSTGFRTTAMSPFAIQRAGTVAVEPYYPWTGFYVAPTWSPYYPGFAPWAGWWDYGGYGVVQVRQPLPTQDMLARAVPEGVIEPGGAVSGYLYFHRVGPDVGALQFQATFVSAETQQKVAQLSVPFEVKG